MDYSMFERPKLPNAKSMKFYPELHDHRIPFRHRKPLAIDLSQENFPGSVKKPKNHSVEAYKKCPIYVHKYPKIPTGDFLPKSKHKNSKTKQKALEKLEETYWANWKPDKNAASNILDSLPPIHVIKSAPERQRKAHHSMPKQGTLQDKITVVSSKSQEIQTEDIALAESDGQKQNVEEGAPEQVTEEKEEEVKFLKHTDSLVLTLQKQKEDKEEAEQPKCIRIYRNKPKTTSKNYVKGGSYPLKSCLKKDAKKENKLNRPTSPVVSSSYSTKSKPRRF